MEVTLSNPKRTLRFLLVLAHVWYLLAGVSQIYLRELTFDTGLYLYAGSLIFDGQVPYRDFYHNQGVLYLIIFAIPQLFASSVLLGRITGLLLGWVLVFQTASIARRHGGLLAEVLATWLLAGNFMLLHFGAKTNVVTALCWLTGLWVLSRTTMSRTGRLFWGSFAIALSAANRIPAIAQTLFATGLLAAFTARTSRERVAVLLGCGVALGVPYGLLYGLGAWEQFWYDAITYQQLRTEHPMFQTSWENKLLVTYKFFRHFCLFLGLLAVGAWVWAKGRPLAATREAFRSAPEVPLAILIGGSHVAAVFALPFLTYTGYFIEGIPPLIALAAAVPAWLGVRDAGTSPQRMRWPWVVLIGAIIMPLTQLQEFVGDRLDDVAEASWQAPIARNRHIGRILARAAGPEGVLMAFEPAWAVDGNLRILPGLEGGFDAYVPSFTREEAVKYRVMNDAMLLEAVEQRIPDVIALTDWDFRMLREHFALGHGTPLSPERYETLPTLTQEVILRHYVAVLSLPKAGQWGRPLYVFERREDSSGSRGN